MSRSGYTEDYDCNDRSIHLYRGRVASALRGKRGQTFLKDLLVQLDAMPEKRLALSQLEINGSVCALGVMTRARGIDASLGDRFKFSEDEDSDQDEWVIDNLVAALDIAEPMVREIMFENDEGTWKHETPEDRWHRMRRWVERHIKP